MLKKISLLLICFFMISCGTGNSDNQEISSDTDIAGDTDNTDNSSDKDTGNSGNDFDGNDISDAGDTSDSCYDDDPGTDENTPFKKYWGTRSSNYGRTVAVDTSGSIYVTGATKGSLDDQVNSGNYDIFLTKLNSAGDKLWTKQWGTSSLDYGYSVITHSSGNVYVTGSTSGGLSDNKNSGEDDIFLTKLSDNGDELWTKQWGTSSIDIGISIKIDSSENIYIAGSTEGGLDGNTNSGSKDIFLTKLNSSGHKLWTKQWGTDKEDETVSVAVDNLGNIYVTGRTDGNLDGNENAGNYDIFITKLDASGNKLWTKQFGTNNYDSSSSVAVNNLNEIFVAGLTYGNLYENTSTGKFDIFLMKLDYNGNKIWTNQWGTELNDAGQSATVDSAGDIYIAGTTFGSLDGNTNTGEFDIFLTKLNSSGKKLWTKQWGFASWDEGYSAAVDISGNIYVTGFTDTTSDGEAKSGSSFAMLTKLNASGEKQWIKLWESHSRNEGIATTIDSADNVYITGYTEGELDGNISAGKQDVFLTKWNNRGEKLWTKQWGSGSRDEGYSAAVDSVGNIYVTGFTEGSIEGNSNSGGRDIFLTKLNSTGSKLWTKQLGTALENQGRSVVVDNSDNIYVAGYTDGDLGNGSDSDNEIFLTKWNSEGEIIWIEQWGTDLEDFAHSATVDKSGNIYVTGYTDGDLDGNLNAGNFDIFITKLDSSGKKLWTKQWGTDLWDEGYSTTVDSSGNIYVAGFTDGSLDGNISAGSQDVFLTKLSNDGNKIWTQQWGTNSSDAGFSLTVDLSDMVYVTGYTDGNLEGNNGAGLQDIFLTKLSSDGDKLWTEQIGTEFEDQGNSVATDRSGHIYITGYTEGSFDENSHAGEKDIFLIKIVKD